MGKNWRRARIIGGERGECGARGVEIGPQEGGGGRKGEEKTTTTNNEKNNRNKIVPHHKKTFDPINKKSEENINYK